MKRHAKVVSCKLLCWSLKQDGIMRPPTCPECFQPAEVGLDMIGRPCYFHVIPPEFPFKQNKDMKNTHDNRT